MLDRRSFLKRLSAMAAVPVLGPLVLDQPVVIDHEELGLVLPQNEQLVIAKEMPRKASGLTGYVKSLDVTRDLVDTTTAGDSWRSYVPSSLGPRFEFTFAGNADGANWAELDRLVKAMHGGSVRLYVEVV